MFYFEKIKNKKILKSNYIENAFFTTKESFIKTKDEAMFDIVEENKKDIIDFLHIKKLISPSQRHTSNIAYAKIDQDYYEEIDALILDDPNIAIYLNFADCTPVIFYDEKENIGAIAHAGWRGTADKIAQKTAQKLIETGSNPNNIKAVIGPCISKCCFEVDNSVAKKLYSTINVKIKETKNGKNYPDLKEINKIQLENVGIKNIDIAPFCTICNNDLFFSYRYENGTTNRHSAVLSLKH